MRAALYARVSTERQERFQTIDSQLATLRDWAATGGHEISDDFVFRDEGYSGSRLWSVPNSRSIRPRPSGE